MAKIFPTPQKQSCLPPAFQPLLLREQQISDSPRAELFLREDAGFVVERMGDDGVGGPIEWVDEDFPRIWRKDI